ncbi:MAG: sulfatase-like hydrolase/transferase [Microcoleaceae cyanobacterium MO_207.B10]|nr:sulfatase-like hydrolase/transferase [Microcoleaceae cyanobacterium MO_207.B10]
MSRAEAESSKKYNILFILTDQEQYFDPKTFNGTGYQLPGRERLRSEGISFTNHQIATSVCTPSRSVIYTGLHMQNNGVFDNLGFSWSVELSSDIPTVGTHLQKMASYHAAYLGKCHFIDALEEIEVLDAPDVNLDELNKIMQEYGFEDYVGVGDIIGNTMGGYRSDEFTTSTVIRWLRAEAPLLQQDEKPWFLAVNLVNPHDVMYYNTDEVGSEPVQDTNHLMKINREPPHALYQQQWDKVPLPETWDEIPEAWEERPENWEETWNEEWFEGRPKAHWEYQWARRSLVGQFPPNEPERWKRLRNYYLNCIADCDRHVDRILQELDDLGLAENTIVIMTSDHGELAGAHSMHGKGATAYKEQVNVPLYIRHPAYTSKVKKPRECQALTSHLDITPTILSLAGVTEAQLQEQAPNLKGRDISKLLESPETAPSNALRDTALYNYNMWLYIDASYTAQVYEALMGDPENPQNPQELGLKPDLRKRGAIRSVTDGRYRYSRYFSPLQHNTPETIEQIFEYNDVELFDLESDPNETCNLATTERREANEKLILEMNQKLNDIIAEEVGEDNGDFLPDENKIGWEVKYFNL